MARFLAQIANNYHEIMMSFDNGKLYAFLNPKTINFLGTVGFLSMDHYRAVLTWGPYAPSF